jgi:hypothetical protein
MRVDLPIYWTDIEATEGVFDFSYMDTQFAAAAAAGLFIETSLNLGRWLSTAHARSAHPTGWLRPTRRSELFHAVRSSTYIVGRRRPTFRREADRDFRII